MPIEIRELIIQVKVEEAGKATAGEYALQEMKKNILRECKKEIKNQLKKNKER